MNLGFLSFPVSQAADILLTKAHMVPIGEDQIPHLEQTREIARRFNSQFGDVFPEPEYLISKFSRLPGLDGKKKMSKSLNNAIYLSDSEEDVENKIKKAYSGEGHALFIYGELFGVTPNDRMEIFKPQLADAINDFLEPIRKRRKELEEDQEHLRRILDKGKERIREIGSHTMQEVREAMKMIY
jgi:tryptophanyl-tRNA synthetase